MKLIALDVGTKRIGVAKADSKVRIAVPHGTITVDGSEIMQIASFARIYGTDYFIIGLPRNSKGEETAQSRYVRRFARALKKVLPDAKIRFQDESLTSVEAERRLEARKKPYSKGDIDAEAAAIILQDFLESFFKPRRAAGSQTSRTAKTQPKAKKSKKKGIIITIIVILLLLIVGGYTFYRIQSLPVASGVDCSNDTQSEACKPRQIMVESGDSVQTVADKLESNGIIRSSLAFQIYFHIHHANDVAAIKVGNYTFNQTATLENIIDQFVNESSNVFRLMVTPGETVRDVKKKLVEQGYSTEQVEAAFAKTYNHPVLVDKPAEASLEGYLFGDTYEFYKGESVEKIITTMLDQLYKVVQDNNLQAAYAEHGLNLYQGITLASIVQKEAKSPEDQAIVAQVFYSRLANGVTLGSDVTAQYAADLVDPNRTTYTTNDAILQIDSPYNTRKVQGLPYGPISNPGLSALQAAAHPADTSYLYFLTGDDGMMYYSSTDEGHQQNIAEHCRELCNKSL